MTRLVALGVAAALVLAGAIVLATSPWSEDEPEVRMRTVPAEPEPVTLRVMTFNIFYGGDELDLATGDWCARRAGCQRTFDRVVAAVEASDADIVGLQETTMNAVTLAERLGWHASERTHVAPARARRRRGHGRDRRASQDGQPPRSARGTTRSQNRFGTGIRNHRSPREH